jgi:hypothetical protein
MGAGSATDTSRSITKSGRRIAARLFGGGGQIGELMRSIDWAKTPAGPVEFWPQSLKTALSILLKQRTAVFIFWGPDHVQFYNDTYRPILGTKKHPAAMGQRGARVLARDVGRHSPSATGMCAGPARGQREARRLLGLSVWDNGIGIEPEYKEHIFGLFKRLHTSDEYSGTGIGLGLCQRIVERYHGRIWVESEPGQGSAFIFSRPT